MLNRELFIQMFLRKPAILIFSLMLAILSVLSFGIGEVLGQPVKGLFTDAVSAPDSYIQEERQNTTVMRSRHVYVNFDKLVSKDIPEGVDAIVMDLFDDVMIIVIKDRLEKRSENKYTWFGHIKDVEHSQVIMVVEDGVMAANITFNGKMYEVRFAGDGVHAIREIDQSKFKYEAPPIPVETPYEPDLTTPSAMLDDGSYIDVMVVYTADARNGAGGTTAMNTQIQLAIDQTNQSYSNSGITQRLRLVHSAEVAYTETGDMETDLNRITNTSDGYMDNVHTLRNTYSADLVSLLVENGGAYCGIAYLMTSVSTSFASYGFSVVDQDCISNYTFGHELGHNMGAHHDRYVTGSEQGAYAYSYGYVYLPGTWRTIMAYNNYCTANGTSCTRLQYWSNPNVTYGGVAMGIPEGSANAADNRKTLNNTAYTVANFRQSSVGNITHTLTAPSNTTVSRGGILGPFYGSITNNGSSSQTVYIYPYMYDPSGTWTLIFSTAVTVSAGGTHSSGAAYYGVPPTASTGAYQHCVYVTDTSGNQLDWDCFSFNVAAGDSSAPESQSSDDVQTLESILNIPNVQVFENEGWKMIIVPEK